MYTWGINSAFNLAEAVSRAGGCQALKRCEPQRAQRRAFLYLCGLRAFVVQGFYAFCHAPTVDTKRLLPALIS